MNAIVQFAANVLADAATKAGKRSSRQQFATALLDGLATLRLVIGENAGLAAQRSFDDVIKHTLIMRGLEYCRLQGSAPVPTPLPAGPADLAADAIIAHAVETCLQLNAVGPDNDCLDVAVRGMLDLLLAQLDGLPSAVELLARLQRDDGRTDDQDDNAPVPQQRFWLQ